MNLPNLVIPPWVKPVAIVAGVLLVIGGILLAVNHIYGKGETAGAAAVTTKVQERTIYIQRSINDAENKGPRTPKDVSRELRGGTF